MYLYSPLFISLQPLPQAQHFIAQASIMASIRLPAELFRFLPRMSSQASSRSGATRETPGDKVIFTPNVSTFECPMKIRYQHLFFFYRRVTARVLAKLNWRNAAVPSILTLQMSQLVMRLMPQSVRFCYIIVRFPYSRIKLSILIEIEVMIWSWKTTRTNMRVIDEHACWNNIVPRAFYSLNPSSSHISAKWLFGLLSGLKFYPDSWKRPCSKLHFNVAVHSLFE